MATKQLFHFGSVEDSQIYLQSIIATFTLNPEEKEILCAYVETSKNLLLPSSVEVVDPGAMDILTLIRMARYPILRFCGKADFIYQEKRYVFSLSKGHTNSACGAICKLETSLLPAK